MGDDGGPAFPVPADVNPEGFARGMSLRDYFAAAALTGIMLADERARIELGGTGRRYSTADEFAKAAYESADAMLAARNTPGDEGSAT